MAASSFPSLQSTGPSSLQLPESLPAPGEDREPHFVHSSDAERFRCSIHGGLLVEPQQTKCGHRFCARCVDTYLGGEQKKPCPVKEPDCEDLSRAEVWRDNSIIRDIKNAQVYCYNKEEGCTTKARFHTLKDHLEECAFEPVACVFAARGCGERVLRGKMAEHRAFCPCRPQRCASCQQEINHSLMQVHRDSECQEVVVGCPFGCGDKKLKRKEVETHKATCPVQPVDCKFKPMGCTFSSKREEVARHEKEDVSKHLELMTLKVATMEMTSMDLQGRIQELSAERDNMQRSLQSLSQDPAPPVSTHHLDTQIRDMKLKMVTVLEKAFTIERKIPDLAEASRVQTVEQNMTRVQQKVTELEQAARHREQQQRSGAGTVGGGGGGGFPAVSVVGGAAGTGRVGRFNNVTEMASAFSEQLDAHDRQLGVHDIRMAEMDLRFQLLETAAYDGKLIWKIRDYERRKSDAVCSRTLSLYSQPFYTNRFGYKMCARVYLNGDGMGKTTHLSLFFVIMRGEYDALLLWPFRQKVTLTLLDQSPEKRHLTDSFQPDPSSSSFQRPTSEMNVASGCPLFVSHSVLENQGNGYLRDDTIFIRITVDDTANASPF